MQLWFDKLHLINCKCFTKSMKRSYNQHYQGIFQTLTACVTRTHCPFWSFFFWRFQTPKKLNLLFMIFRGFLLRVTVSLLIHALFSSFEYLKELEIYYFNPLHPTDLFLKASENITKQEVFCFRELQKDNQWHEKISLQYRSWSQGHHFMECVITPTNLPFTVYCFLCP